MEPPFHLPRHLQQRLVLLLREDDPGGVLLPGLPGALERALVQQQAAPLVPRPRRPVEHGHQERQVACESSGWTRACPRADPSRAALPDEPIQSRWESVDGSRSLPKKWRNIAVAVLSLCCVSSALVGVTSSPQMSRSRPSLSGSGSDSALALGASMNPAANRSPCLYARAQSRCLRHRLSIPSGGIPVLDARSDVLPVPRKGRRASSDPQGPYRDVAGNGTAAPGPHLEACRSS